MYLRIKLARKDLESYRRIHGQFSWVYDQQALFLSQLIYLHQGA